MGAAEEAKEMAAAAIARIDKHEAVCSERYGTILRNQEFSALERKEMHEANQNSIRRIYGLLWKVALGLIGGMAILLFHNLLPHLGG